MPAERAGYTVTMFLVDVSPSMGKSRTVELPPGPEGEERVVEMTSLEWSLQFVKLKIQEMIYNGRKTDQCGVILFGSEETDNILNNGYEHVSEYISIAQPNASTLAMLDLLEPSETAGDPIDALIVGIETQAQYLSNKKTWTRKIVLVTDGQNPIEIEDWQTTVRKMDSLDISLTVIGVDFDDEELPFHEEDKSHIKRTNEAFYAQLTDAMKSGVVGTCALALREIARPDMKITKSVLMGTVLRLGDVLIRPEEAVEILVKTSKCTSITRPKGWKKFGKRVEAKGQDGEAMEVDGEEGEGEEEGEEGKGEKKEVYAQLRMRTEYFVDRTGGDKDDEAEDIKVEEDDDDVAPRDKPLGENMEKVEQAELIRGFKYGSTYVPCPEGQFSRLDTQKGIDILGFFRADEFRHELCIGEIQYVWADPGNAQQQVALSSIVQAMRGKEGGKELYAIARWVTKDGMDPKMGVLAPSMFEKVDCLLWAQMPFADDVRKYTFASLDNLVSKNGEKIKKHAYLPTEEQMEAMDKFVDAMDLMDAGEKDDEGNRLPWFDPVQSYNPAVHRTKQALFHCAVVPDVKVHPLPPPHPELLKYLEPPKRVLKRSREATQECVKAFKVTEVPKKVARQRKDGHVRAQDDDEAMILLDVMKPKPPKPTHASQPLSTQASMRSIVKHTTNADDSDTEPESDAEDGRKPPSSVHKPTTPPRSRSNTPVHPLVGTTYPLADFQKVIGDGDLISQAVEAFAGVIGAIVESPEAMKRKEEILICMKALRDVALKEDEVDKYNSFFRDLRKTCTKANLPELWSAIVKAGKMLSIIGPSEAKKYKSTAGDAGD